MMIVTELLCAELMQTVVMEEESEKRFLQLSKYSPNHLQSKCYCCCWQRVAIKHYTSPSIHIFTPWK